MTYLYMYRHLIYNWVDICLFKYRTLMECVHCNGNAGGRAAFSVCLLSVVCCLLSVVCWLLAVGCWLLSFYMYLSCNCLRISPSRACNVHMQ
jgi:hypothetical protein